MDKMNKYPYRDSQGNHVSGGPLTGWRITDAIRQCKCSRCGADSGYYCVTPSGRKASETHAERFASAPLPRQGQAHRNPFGL